MTTKKTLRDSLLGLGVGVILQLGNFLFGKNEVFGLFMGFFLAPPLLVVLKVGLSGWVFFILTILYWGSVGFLVGSARGKRVFMAVVVILLGVFHAWAYFLVEKIMDNAGNFFASYFFK